MRIAMDVREAQSPHPTGKGVWVRRVLEELRKRSGMHHMEAWNLEPGTSSVLWHLRTALHLLSSPPDVYLSPTSFLVPFLVGRQVRTIPVVHDLIAFDPCHHDRKATIIERLTLPRVLRTAAHVCTVSEATKREMLERFPRLDPGRVTAVYEGPSLSEAAKVPSSKFQDPQQRYILSIGTLCPRKNQLRLIQAYNALPQGMKAATKLILVGGRGWDDQEVVRLARASEGVEWRGYLPQAEVEELLRHASVFAYLSLKEGFGLPVLDALTLGIPTLTSNRSSLVEVAGDAALLVDPDSVDGIRHGLERLISDAALRQRLQDAGPKQASRFSWSRTVDLLLEVCGKI